MIKTSWKSALKSEAHLNEMRMMSCIYFYHLIFAQLLVANYREESRWK